MNIWGVVSEVWALHCLLWKLLIVSWIICKVVEVVVLILIELVGGREELRMLRLVEVRHRLLVVWLLLMILLHSTPSLHILLVILGWGLHRRSWFPDDMFILL